MHTKETSDPAIPAIPAIPSDADLREAHAALTSRPAFGGPSSGVASADEQVSFPMGQVAREGVSVVAKLIESLVDNGTQIATHDGHRVEDVPVFTADHESRLLTEAYAYPLPNGRTARMLECANGCRCAGMHPSLQGHDACGGIVLRGILTQEELTRFEQTGENPDEPRLCVMCARLYVAEAYFWCQESRDERKVRNVVLNWYVNPKNCPGGYKGEHTIPLAAYDDDWSGMCGPVACNSFHKMRLVRRDRAWIVDQSELLWNERPRSFSEQDPGRVFR
jgi:hypothetical protein